MSLPGRLRTLMIFQRPEEREIHFKSIGISRKIWWWVFAFVFLVSRGFKAQSEIPYAVPAKQLKKGPYGQLLCLSYVKSKTKFNETNLFCKQISLMNTLIIFDKNGVWLPRNFLKLKLWCTHVDFILHILSVLTQSFFSLCILATTVQIKVSTPHLLDL